MNKIIRIREGLLKMLQGYTKTNIKVIGNAQINVSMYFSFSVFEE